MEILNSYRLLFQNKCNAYGALRTVVHRNPRGPKSYKG
jgi:hypothetical protein